MLDDLPRDARFLGILRCVLAPPPVGLTQDDKGRAVSDREEITLDLTSKS